MKVDKLIAVDQNADWFQRITNECTWEYPINIMEDIQPDELVIDAGCNVGGFTQAYKSRFTNIIPIDASGYNIEQYKAHHPEFNPIHKALYSTDGEIVKLKKCMYGESDTNSGNFSISGHDMGNGNGWVGDEYEEVETLSLETLLSGVDSVGLLKLDIEGAEWEFIYGKDLNRIKWITMELHNFLGEEKQKQFCEWIERTHIEVASNGDGKGSHFNKTWRRKV
jgi:hypothetical protein